MASIGYFVTVNPLASFVRTLSSYLAIVLFVLFLAYLGARLVGKMRFGKCKSHNMELVGKFFLGPEKAFYLLKVANKVYLIGDSKNGFTLIDVFDEEKFKEDFRIGDVETSKKPVNSDFLSIFKDKWKDGK